ncbi:hypothetical protein DsansV1_C05g0057711 [Dioscorea sansibarensis]
MAVEEVSWPPKSKPTSKSPNRSASKFDCSRMKPRRSASPISSIPAFFFSILSSIKHSIVFKIVALDFTPTIQNTTKKKVHSGEIERNGNDSLHERHVEYAQSLRLWLSRIHAQYVLHH